MKPGEQVNEDSKSKTEEAVNEDDEGNEAPEKELEDENLNLMSDKDFMEHMWKKFCGRPRPAAHILY